MQNRMTGPRELVLVRGMGFVPGRRSQIFIFSVLWSDGSDNFIYRTFQEFRQFHKRLKDAFPLEAGLLKSSDCVLPKFPDAFILLPSRRTRRGLARLKMLEAYSQELLGAPETVSRSEVVTGFFQTQPGDLEPVLPQHSMVIIPSSWERPEQSPRKPPALGPDIYTLETQTFRCLDSFSTQDTRGRPFKVGAGEELDVFLRKPTGWWLVENGDKQTAWFPAPYLEAVTPKGGCEATPAIPGSGVLFWSAGAYQGSREDELSVPAGARVTVLEASECGWWRCRYRDRDGLLPAVLLHRCPDPGSAGGLDVLLGAGRGPLGLGLEPEPGPRGYGEAMPCGSRAREGRLPAFTRPAEPPRPSSPSSSSESDWGSDDGGSGATPASGSLPAVPTRPEPEDILRRCCSVTRRAHLRLGAPRPPAPTRTAPHPPPTRS